MGGGYEVAARLVLHEPDSIYPPILHPKYDSIHLASARSRRNSFRFVRRSQTPQFHGGVSIESLRPSNTRVHGQSTSVELYRTHLEADINTLREHRIAIIASSIIIGANSVTIQCLRL